MGSGTQKLRCAHQDDKLKATVGPAMQKGEGYERKGKERDPGLWAVFVRDV
jgi:hypothetical protein